MLLWKYFIKLTVNYHYEITSIVRYTFQRPTCIYFYAILYPIISKQYTVCAYSTYKYIVQTPVFLIVDMRCPPDYVCAIEGSSIILKFSIEGFVYYSTFKQGPYSKNKLIFRNFTKKLDLHIFNVSYIDEGIYRYIMKEFVWVKLKVASKYLS